MKFRFGRPAENESFDAAVSGYSDKEFESPFRSTVPMLSLMRHALETFQKVVEQTGMPDAYEAILEYTVRPQQGRGKASHTDVMLIAEAHSLAIEAKWTEPMYDPVSKWLDAGTNRDNRELVLSYWLGHLEPHARSQLSIESVSDCTYQMVHRAASAAESGTNPRLAYFLFKPSPDSRSATSDQIRDQLTRLWNAMGQPDGFPFYLVEIKLEFEMFSKLEVLAKASQETAEQVTTALQTDKPLFNFADPRVTRIGEES